MTAKRTIIDRSRKPAITEEMVELYWRGRKLKREKGGSPKMREARRFEFLTIAKRLEWTLLGRAPHQVSVFADLRGSPPPYMAARNSETHPDFNGWRSGQELQRRLDAALAARKAS